MCLLPVPGADGPRLLGGAGVVGAQAGALEGVELDEFVGDRVLDHGRERAQDPERPPHGAALLYEHVVDDREGVATPEIAQRPVAQRPPLDCDIENPPDAVLVGVVGALGARMPSGPGLEVEAEGKRRGDTPAGRRLAGRRERVPWCRGRSAGAIRGRVGSQTMGLLDGLASFALELEGAGAATAAVGVGVAREPTHLTVGVDALDGILTALGGHAASSRS